MMTSWTIRDIFARIAIFWRMIDPPGTWLAPYDTVAVVVVVVVVVVAAADWHFVFLTWRALNRNSSWTEGSSS